MDEEEALSVAPCLSISERFDIAVGKVSELLWYVPFTAKCAARSVRARAPAYPHYLAVPFLIRNFRMHNDKRRASIIRRRFLRPYISSESAFEIARSRTEKGERETEGERERERTRETRKTNGEHVGQINMVDAHVPKRTRVGGLVIFGGDDFSKSNVTKRSYYKFYPSPTSTLARSALPPVLSVRRYVA